MGWSNISYTRLTEPVRTTLDPRKVQRSDDIYTYIHTPQLHQKEGYPYHPTVIPKRRVCLIGCFTLGALGEVCSRNGRCTPLIFPLFFLFSF